MLTTKSFLFGLILCLALGISLSAHADDENLTGPDGQVYRISPTDPSPQATATAAPAKASRDHSGVGNFNVNAIARQSLQYHQPTNHANRSLAYR